MCHTQGTHAFSKRKPQIPIPQAWLCIPSSSYITNFHEVTRFRGVGSYGGSAEPRKYCRKEENEMVEWIVYWLFLNKGLSMEYEL